MTDKQWDATDPGNQAMDDQRDAHLRALVAGLGRPVARALDVGCGQGRGLGALGLGEVGTGIDIGLLRLRLAPGPVAQADAARLPFPAGAFDLVLAANVFSSITSEPTRRVAATEIGRVLAPDGVVLWYDQRWPNAANRATRPVTRRDLAGLFPGARLELQSTTVVPALARALPRRYDTLARLRALHSHLVGLVSLPDQRRPPGASGFT